MLDSLNFSTASTGPVTGKLVFSRGPMDPRSSIVDRSVTRHERASEADRTNEFEGYLNGFGGACASLSGSDPLNLQVPVQPLEANESELVAFQPALAMPGEVGAFLNGMDPQNGNCSKIDQLTDELPGSGLMSKSHGLTDPDANDQSSVAITDDSIIAGRSELGAISSCVAFPTPEPAQVDASIVQDGGAGNAVHRTGTGYDFQPLRGFNTPNDQSESANQSSKTASADAFAKIDFAAATGGAVDSKWNTANRPSVGLNTQLPDHALDPALSGGRGKFGPTEAGVTSTDPHPLTAPDTSVEDADSNSIIVGRGRDVGTDLSQITAAMITRDDPKDNRDAATGDLGGGERRGPVPDGGNSTADSMVASRGLLHAATNPALDAPTGSDSRPSATPAEQIYSEIATRVELSQRDGKTDFRMRLDPPGLGTVHVHLTASDHSISARLVVNDEAARQAIESQLHSLRESLAGVGVSLERFDVARDGGGSRGTWQWQQPEPLPPTAAFRVQRSARRPNRVYSRLATGAIDVVA